MGTGNAARPRRQEQEPATTAITEVAPGVLRLQLPISLPGLGHVNCYALEDERGVALVDPGLPGRAPWQALEGRLRLAGIPLRRVHTVVVTHSHPDHFGGAGRLRKETGARVVAHRSVRLWWDPREPDDVDIEVAAAERERRRATSRAYSRRTPWGGEPIRPPFRARMRYRLHGRFPGVFGTPAPTLRLDDAETIRLARREWVAVHTPGHTEDHLCLYDPAEGVLLSGDHVLPTITPHISGVGRSEDPLEQFFASLDRMHTLSGVQQVLPAHGHPFTDLGGRVEAIKRHHEERLERLRHASRELGRPATVPELSTFLFSPRAQGPMADSETYAHLEHLRRSGLAERREEPSGYRYEVA
jgi:glyoxylase-like metal-dependent hydrolase (beta-lactamase superfamily II)